MNELYRDNSIDALNFYSKALQSGGCMNCGHCPIRQELLRLQGDGMMHERHAPLRRARHQRLMRGGTSTALVPMASGVVSNYVNGVQGIADSSPLVTAAMAASVFAVKKLYDRYKMTQKDKTLDPVQKQVVEQELAKEIKKEGSKVIKAATKPRKPRKPRATIPRKPAARRPAIRKAPARKKRTKKVCRMVRVCK